MGVQVVDRRVVYCTCKYRSVDPLLPGRNSFNPDLEGIFGGVQIFVHSQGYLPELLTNMEKMRLWSQLAQVPAK